MRVVLFGDNLALEIPPDHFYNEIARACPKRRRHPAKGLWEIPPWLQVMEWVKQNMPNLNWTAGAEAKYYDEHSKEMHRQKVSRGEIEIDPDDLTSVPFKLPPYDHQAKALLLGRNQDVFAYLMDQGTGKTKVLIDDAAHNFREDRIDGFLIISPNSVKTNWVDTESDDDEIEKHMPPDIPYVKAAFFASMNREQKKDWEYFYKYMNRKDFLMVLSMNVEGIWSQKAEKVALDFVKKRRCMIVIDESTRIGNRSSKRTKTTMALRKYCPVARIASGTPVIKSPLKAYSQFGFLNPSILGSSTYTEFAARHAVIKKQENGAEIAVRYLNTDILAEKIAGVSFRVLKEDCLDLPPKVYQKRTIYLANHIMDSYRKMRDHALVWLDAQNKVEAPTALAQLVRLQQITAGYLPIIDEETGEQTGIKKLDNGPPAKVQEAMDIIEECEGKVIVWCKFKFEIAEMEAACRAMGVSCVTFSGDTSEADRLAHRQRFQNDPSLKVFIGQVRTGGIGITLHAASTVIYLSNTFSTEDRVQSEDRAHRIGQTKSVNYYDLVAKGTVDVRILHVLRSNKMVSDEVMRDGYRAWI